MTERDRLPRGAVVVAGALVLGALVTPLVAGGSAGAGGAGGPPPSLDFAYYVENVEPIFMRDRGTFGVGAACVTCHTWQTGTPLSLEPLSEDERGRVFWSEGQSRRNFEAVSRLVLPGDPERSRLLRKPLSPAAGGAVAHTGGAYWDSPDDPEYRVIAGWIRAAAAPGPPVAVASPTLDFEFFRTCVQRIFLDERPGLVRCASCHTSGERGFAPPIPDGRDFWNPEESRANFGVAQRLIEPGDPYASRLLLHPLDFEAGGSYMHNGGRRWTSQDDPEWRMLAAWVRGEEIDCVL
jgi:mono/diheme cytochrome c family protein